MVVAAYLVGGFLIASVYAVGDAARAARDRYHRLGFIIAVHRRRDRDAGPDGRRRRAGPLGLQQPAGQVRRDRAGAHRPSSDVPETLLGHLNSDGTVSGGIPIPGLASLLSDPEHRHGPRSSRGWTRVPADDRPTVRRGQHRPPRVGRHGRPRHAAVPAVASWYGAQLDLPAADADEQVVPARSPPPPGVLAVITMEAGWVVTEVGRQPWIVYNLHEGRGRGHRQHRGLDHVHRGRRALPRGWASPRSSSCAA